MKSGVKIVSFTEKGARLCQRIQQEFVGIQAYGNPKYLQEGILPLEEPVGDWAARWFGESEALVFIGAAGIAVRAVGSLARSKGSDPAVLCMDELGRFVIPLLSGHIGGANRMAEELAAVTGGLAVITTATDVNGVFAPDTWAVAHGCAIPDVTQIKEVSAALLGGETVGLVCDFPVEGNLPAGVVKTGNTRCGIYIGLQAKMPFQHTLWLVPKCLRLGIGCRKGVEPALLEEFVLEQLAVNRLPLAGVSAVATIELKGEEPALQAFCNTHRLPLEVSTAPQLESVGGSSASSAFVREVTGVDNVCERAALKGGGALIVGKTAGNGVTVAVAKQDWRANF